MKSAIAIAVKLDVYSENKAGLATLRDESLWQIAENNGVFRGGGLPKKIVKKFHEAKGK